MREQKQKAQAKSAERDELRKRPDMSEFLRDQPTAITEYDELLVRRLNKPPFLRTNSLWNSSHDDGCEAYGHKTRQGTYAKIFGAGCLDFF